MSIAIQHTPLREVKLYGHLAKKFGKVHRLAVASVNEAVRALSFQLPGFRKHLLEHSEPGYRIFVGDQNIDERELGMLSGDKEIRIVPVVAGAGGDSGLLTIIVGVVLVAAAIFTAGAALGFAAGWASITGAAGAAAASTLSVSVLGLGMSMILSGVMQMIIQPPKAHENVQGKTAASYLFGGAVNVTQEGTPIPLLYGELEVGSVMVEASVKTIDIGIDDDKVDGSTVQFMGDNGQVMTPNQSGDAASIADTNLTTVTWRHVATVRRFMRSGVIKVVPVPAVSSMPAKLITGYYSGWGEHKYWHSVPRSTLLSQVDGLWPDPPRYTKNGKLVSVNRNVGTFYTTPPNSGQVWPEDLVISLEALSAELKVPGTTLTKSSTATAAVTNGNSVLDCVNYFERAVAALNHINNLYTQIPAPPAQEGGH